MSLYARPSAGHAIRLRRIFAPSDGRTLVIPLDHTAADGLILGLSDSRKVIANAEAGGADAVMLRPGLLHAFSEVNVRSLGVIVMLTGRLSRGLDHVLFNSVEHAIRCGADAVCAEFKLGSDGDLENARLASTVAECARQFGLPVLMTSYALPYQIEKVGNSAYAQACRICEELGADMIKTSLPPNPEIISSCLDSVRIPIILAGGSGGEPENLFAEIETAVKLGISGAAIGRKVWGSKDPVGVARRLSKIIHGAPIASTRQ